MAGKVKRRLLVDSRYRKPNEEPDDYTIEFLNPVTDVTSISLVGSTVPFSANTVSRGNDTFSVTFTVDSEKETHVLSLPHGPVADTSALLTALHGALPDGLSASVDDGRIAFSSATYPFAVYGSGSVARLLGFRPHIPTNVQVANSRAAFGGLQSTGQGPPFHASCPYMPDLTPEPYLVLSCTIGGALLSPEQSADGALAILFAGEKDVAHPFPAKPSTSDLHRVSFRVTRPTGEPYDFQGRDHRLEFEIT